MISQTINGISLKFQTSNDVFSPSHLDPGTLAMLSVISFDQQDKLLDLGCGYGLVGIYAAKIISPKNITMCDVSEECVNLSIQNCKLNQTEGIPVLVSDGFDSIDDKDFTLILSNPPYHANFSVPKRFIEDGYKKLAPNGKMYMVTKRKDWYKNKFINTFGGVKIHYVDDYYIFIGEKKRVAPKADKNKKNISKKLARKTYKSASQSKMHK